ncbi:hypothetical protein FB451DRAFT_1277908 [Mycena latifolia]|nr:hypothetical protein FB451DRAFT_1277908 [Mycena latifolia]
MEINEDIFSCILSLISDSKTLYSVLTALPTSHLLFPAALARLWQLPVYLDSSDPIVADASQKVLNYLFKDNSVPPLVASVRHLVITAEYKPPLPPPPRRRGRGRGRRVPPSLRIPAEVTALHERIPKLLRRAVNLESLDYHSFLEFHSLPGIGLKGEHVQALSNLQGLRRFSVDCALRSRVRDMGAGMGPGDWSAEYDAENWELEPFISTVGPKITSLHFRHVNKTMFTALTNNTDVFASYHNLEHLKIDITEGVWDWNGNGSPAMGATPGLTFPFLGFPSVRRFELIVCDQTLTGSAHGPLDLVDRNLLTSLTIDVRHSLGWMTFEEIKLFEALTPLDFPVLSFLEIRDNAKDAAMHYWESADEARRHGRERVYHGLVPSFLGAIDIGALPNLTTLWVDERVLLPGGISVQDLLATLPPSPSSPSEPTNILNWTRSLRAALAQLDSLRVGFGAIDHIDAEVILDLCDPQKLVHFGFEWRWSEYLTDDPIAHGLLDQLSRFPKLTDVHILFPRPQTHLPGPPDPTIDAQTLEDVASIFGCNGSISRVGIGNSLVWERHPSEPSRALLVSDESIAANPAVPRFYHAGYVAKRRKEVVWRNAIPPRPDRGAEIEQLRSLLQKIVT